MTKELAKKYLPEHAHCVFEGVIFDVYHWQQEMFDGSFSTFEAIIREGTVQLLCINEDSTITLFEERQPHFDKPLISLPGGQIDKGENPEVAAKRELKEELGWEGSLELWRVTGSSKKIIWPTYFYIVRKCRKVCEPELDSGEDIIPFNVSFEEFLEYCEDKRFRNKALRDVVFRIKQDPEELKKLKDKLS